MSLRSLPIEKDDYQSYSMNMLGHRRMAGTVFDNKERFIDLQVLEEIKKDPLRKYGNHHTQYFWFGHVFYVDGKWREVIRFKGNCIGYWEADTPEELMLEVNKKYEHKQYSYGNYRS